jgi:hypothetical protein
MKALVARIPSIRGTVKVSASPAKVYKRDGVTLLTEIPGNGSKLITQLMALETAAELYGDLDAIGLLDDLLLLLDANDIASLTDAQVQLLTAAQIHQLIASQVQALTAGQVQQLTQAQVQALSEGQVQELSNVQVQELSALQIAALTNGQIWNLTAAQIQALLAAQVQQLTAGQVQNLTGAQVQQLNGAQVQQLTNVQLESLTAGQVQHLIDDGQVPTAGVRKADGVTVLTTIVAGLYKTTQQILTLMSGAEIVADLNAIGNPQKAYVARQLDNVYTYTVNISAIGDDSRAFQLQHTGTIDTVTPANLTTYTFKINGTTAAVPFTHNRGDLLTITVTRTNTALAGSIVLTGYDAAEANTALSAADQAADRYIAIINPVDQTVSVIDTDVIKNNLNSHAGGLWGGLNPVIATITLTPVATYRCIAYRETDKCWYVFANGRILKIDANPASPTFATILTSIAPTTGFGSIASAVGYDFDRDLFWVQDISGNRLSKSTPAGVSANMSLMNSGSSAAALVNYIPGLRSVWLGGTLFDTLTEVINGGLNSGSPLGMAALNRKNGLLYVVENSRMYVVNAYNRTLVTSLSNNARRSGIAINETADRAYASDMFGSTIVVVNTATNTTAATITKANVDTNEGGSGDVLYSKSASLVFALGFNATGSVTTGNSRLHVIDPNTNTDKGYVTVGQQGGSNMGISLTRMALNRLQL